MSLREQYKKKWDAYEVSKSKAAAGDRGAMADKAKQRVELKQMEREAARDGVVLEPAADKQGRYTGTVSAEETETKRSLQQEMVRKFDREAVVKFKTPQGEYEGDLRTYHEKRLGLKG